MPDSSYYPKTQAAQVKWNETLNEIVGSKIALYGVSTAMMQQYSALVAILLAAWSASENPTTRTRGVIAARNVALQNAKKAAGSIVATIQANPDVTDQMKLDAGLTVRKTKPSRQDAPDEAPVLTIVGVDGRTVTVKLTRPASTRGKPKDAQYATVLTSVSETPPLSIDGFQLAMTASQTTVDVPFGPSETGDTVWITAMWANARGSGPAAKPQSVSLPAGGQIKTASPQPKLRIAQAA